MTLGLVNANPVVHAKRERIARTEDLLHAVADDAVDPLDVFDTNSVRDIRDPEHPYSLEQLSVLSEESITVDEKLGRIRSWKPFIEWFLVFLASSRKLQIGEKDNIHSNSPTLQFGYSNWFMSASQADALFPPHFKVDINVAPGSHANEESVNKQLNDKERVAAALENPNLLQLVDECLYSNEL